MFSCARWRAQSDVSGLILLSSYRDVVLVAPVDFCRGITATLRSSHATPYSRVVEIEPQLTRRGRPFVDYPPSSCANLLREGHAQTSDPCRAYAQERSPPYSPPLPYAGEQHRHHGIRDILQRGFQHPGLEQAHAGLAGALRVHAHR